MVGGSFGSDEQLGFFRRVEGKMGHGSGLRVRGKRKVGKFLQKVLMVFQNPPI